MLDRMYRPNCEDYYLEGYEVYTNDLEKYCDYLEKIIDRAGQELYLSNVQLRKLDSRYIEFSKSMWKEFLFKESFKELLNNE